MRANRSPLTVFSHCPALPMRRFGVGLAALGLGMGVLTGCGEAVETGTEQAIEGALGGDASVDVELDDGSVSITDPQLGQAEIGAGAEVPAAWPVAVPLYPFGTLSAATVNDMSGIYALWTEPAVDRDRWNEYFDLLVREGFAENGMVVSDSNGDSTTVHSLRGNGWELTLAFTSSEEEGSIVQLTGIPTTP